MPCHSEPMTARDAIEVVRKGIIGLYDQQAMPDDSAQPKLDEALAALSNLVERAGEPVAYCCPHDPDSATAFAWPGTKRSAETHTLALYALTTAPGASHER